MTNSKNSSNPRATSRRGPKGEKAASRSTDLDRPLKLGCAQSLASAGIYVRMNVVLSEPCENTRGGRWVADITDVDVLGISHSLDLSADISCVSCKAGTRVAVLHEAFALAGVMKYLRARRGYGVFAQKAIESHMIALGQQLDIALMDQGEWQSWCRRVSGPFSVPRMFEDVIDATLSARLAQRTDLETLLRYLRTEFWYYRDYRNVKTLIVQLRHSADCLTSSPLSQFVLLDAAGLFAVALLQMCEYVNTSGLSRLADAAPPYLFGGVATYRNRKELLRKVEGLLRAKNLIDTDQGMPPLDPPYLSSLLDIVLRWCSKPSAAARVPQYLSVRAGFAAAAATGSTQLSQAHGESDLTEKLALDVIEFLGGAARLRSELVLSVTRDAPASRASVASRSSGITVVPKSAGQIAVLSADTEQPDLLLDSNTGSNAGGVTSRVSDSSTQEPG